MLKRTRVGSIPDMVRLSAAVARPGIDTRVWCSLAVALGESHVDPAHGVFVDVALLPTGEEYTARVPSGYAGPSYGDYAKVHEKDELLVLIPRGDPAEGPVVVCRLWDTSDVPPPLANSNADDKLLVVEVDKTLRLVTSGSGKSYIKSAAKVILDAPNVHLGGEDPTEQVILGTTYRTHETTMDTAQQAALAIANGGQIAAGAGATTAAGAGGLLLAAGAFMLIPIAGPIIAGPFVTAAGGLITGGMAALTAGLSTTAGALTTMSTNIGTFEGAAASYLSTVTKTR